MTNNSTLNNFISEYQFNEFITDEELMRITEVFNKMKTKISSKILDNILNYSKVLEVHSSDRLKSQMILN